MPGPSLTGIAAGLMPAYTAGQTLFFKASVSTAARLGALITIPTMPWDNALYTDGPPPNRTPYHIFFQVPASAANPIYVTWDNTTVPVVGGPGMEMEPGTIYTFYNCGPTLTPQGIAGGPAGKVGGIYQVNAASAFQFIATAATTLLVWFSD
jgi:hypothetical protein